MLTIDYRSADQRAVLSWSSADENATWIEAVRRLMFDRSEDVSQENAWMLSLPWWAFVSARPQLFKLFSGHGLSLGNDFSVTDGARTLLTNSKRALESHETAKNALSIPEADLRERLRTIGFERELSPEQARNVGRLAALPAAATFSVPGAGKTTEALACFFYKAKVGERLLVIAPKNAFAAWDEQIADCMPPVKEGFVRLRGGRDKIAKALLDDPKFMLITYQQFVRVADLLTAHSARYPTHVFLDESHRIKSGSAKQTARAVLNLAHLPIGKLIMSGTPMPQSTEDLIPQFAFLYPELPATTDTVVDLIKPVYVRTTKKELGLPPVTPRIAPLPMAPMQAELYKLMKFEVAREAATALGTRSRQAFRALGRSVARLLQFVSNPSLLSSEIEFAQPDLLAAVLAEGDGPKMKYVLKRARALAREGHKVLIWSSFVRNVEYIAERLADLGAVYIHGGVDAGDEDDDETREGKIKLFHDDPTVRIMVANPAAASEGVSLHRVCHHALYLDRTFNAAHYLQSQDRIHRFGLPADQATVIEIVECLGSVDETVRERLDTKIGRMAEALEDSSLKPDPIPIDPNDIEDYEEYGTGLLPEDIHALLRDLSGGSRMTAFSPGLALACFELLEMAVRRDMRLAGIATEFSKIGVMATGKVLDLAQTLKWIRSGYDGRATVTVEGQRILSLPGYEGRIRQALLDYIDVVRPPWVQNATFGRAKVIAFAGSDIAQVFVEAGLAHGTKTEVVEFWDELAARARGQRGIRLNVIGRAGERLTIEHETRRTDRTPRWISIDSNADGYDVLSVAGPSDPRHLSIEVKATKIGLAGSFHLTANEWERAIVSDLHAFHLWDMSSSCPALAELSKDDVAPHVPADRGEGRWETVEIPFGAFSRMFAPLAEMQILPC